MPNPTPQALTPKAVAPVRRRRAYVESLTPELFVPSPVRPVRDVQSRDMPTLLPTRR